MKTTRRMTSMVRDDFTGDWIVLAGAREGKPTGFGKKAKDPFAPEVLRTSARLLATYGNGKEIIYAIQNSYPVFGDSLGIGGKQEVLVEGTTCRPFWTSSESQIVALLNAIAARFAVHRKNPAIRYLQAFKNEGKEAGASQPHPHSQLFAVPFVPGRMNEITTLRRTALQRLGMSSHQHALSNATKELTIFRDANVVAYANPMARYAYEVRIVPVRRFDSITDATPAERSSIAKALRALFPLLKKRKFAYNFFFHDIIGDPSECFEIRVVPRVEVSGGFELDTGVYVNPVLPERAAKEYREASI